MAGWLSDAFRALTVWFGEAIKPKEAGELDKTRATLVQAGFRQHNASEIYWGIKAGAAMRLRLRDLGPEERPRSDTAAFSAVWAADSHDRQFIRDTIERWRRQIRCEPSL